MDALPALGSEQRHDVVADGERRDVGADALDHTGTLVPEHAWRVAARIHTGSRVEIRVTDTARAQADEDLSGLRLGKVELLDDERLAELLEHGGADPHSACSSPVV